MKTCPICSGPSSVVWHGLYDDRYGHPGAYSLLRCRTCGHKFLDASFTATELRALYSDHYPRGERRLDEFAPPVEVRGFKAWLEGERASAFRWVPRDVRVLDVGCGFGETLAYHQARGCDAYGVDLDEHLLQVAERYGLNARVGVFDARDYEPSSFDFVTLDQVIEHALDPRSFLRDVATVLRPGGLAILATPNSNGYGRLLGRRWINWHAPYHLQQFSRRSLAHLAEEAGFAIVSIRTVTSSRWLNYQWFHLFAYPARGVASPYWDPQRSPLIMGKRPTRVGDLLNQAKVFDLVTRLADAVGQGDNFLCILKKREELPRAIR